MKIGIDARFYGPEHSGLGRYTMNFINALSRVDKKNEYYLFLPEKYAKKLKLNSNFHALTCDTKHYTLREQFNVGRHVDSQKLDLFHALHFNVPVFMKTQFIVTIHDLIKTHFRSKDTTTRPSPLFYVKRVGYTYVMNTATKKAKKIIVPSEFVKKDLAKNLQLNSQKVIVIPEAPDPIFLSKSKSVKPNNTILFVGNAYPHKNLQTLINALDILPDKKVRLIVVSKNTPFLKKVLKSANGGLKKRIKIESSVTDKKLKNLYQKASLVVIPSLMEGYGLVGIEALTSGTPILVSDIPVFHEVYGNNANYFSPTDHKELAKQIEKHLSKRTNRIKYSHPYDWEDVAKEVVEVYSEVGSRLRSS